MNTRGLITCLSSATQAAATFYFGICRLAWSLGTLFICWTALQSSFTHAAEKPNILFLFADDLSYEAIREFGHLDIDTPNLDQLAKQGTTFTHAYNMGSYSGAVCVASRTMLNTGRTVWRAAALQSTADQERIAGRLWPQLMKQQGYDTYFTGKWHVTANASKSFDTVRHIRGGMPKTVPEAYNRPIEGQPDLWSPFDKSIGGFWEGGTHWSEVVADDAIDFLNAAKKASNPFFMYVAFNASHDPRQSPEEYIAKYPLERVAVPDDFLPQYPYAEAMKAGKGLRDEKLAPFPRTPYAVKVHRQEYFALITHMDNQIGRILDTLDQLGLRNNTVIIFTADHGLAVGHHGLMGKQNMYDHSLRVPFIIAGPGIPKGQQISAPIYLQDLMPTCLELAGGSIPSWVEFQSLLPLLMDSPDATIRTTIYGAYLDAQRSIIQDGWKLIVYPQAKRVRLYHLTSDPHERHDLADDPAQQPRIRKMFHNLQKLQTELDDSVDLTKTFSHLTM